MKGRGRERGAGGPPERVPTGVDLRAEGTVLRLGQTGRTTIPTPPRGRGRDPMRLLTWRQAQGPIGEE